MSAFGPSSSSPSSPALEATPGRPRVLRVDLSAARGIGRLHEAARRSAWRSPDAALDRVGAWSGAALALALLEEHARARPHDAVPLVVALGECVRLGRPTASRATLASRAPLTGRLADGQVGGELARRLASVADALVLEGRTRVPGALLVVRADGSVELESRPELRGASPRATDAAIRALHGDVATLCIGPGGERGLPFASLAAGGDPPHFVGRGGLGAVLGRAGLKAVAIDAPAVEPAGERELTDALLASPRLEARARAGTLELFEALAARGEAVLGGRADGGPSARAAAAELAGARRGRHGCAGCPTPCGWVFDTGTQRGEQAARFSATYALGLRLGLARASDALELLARCDEAGLDAREVGAGLALLCQARQRGLLPGGPAWGAREQLETWIDELLRGAGQGGLLAGGAAAFAREHGLEGVAAGTSAVASRERRDLAADLGAGVSVRGADPMRTFPFLVHDGADVEQVARLVEPLALPAGATDPRQPAGKGRLVWWHENLSAALDTCGFCAFSAAALLSDGLVDLERLARWIEPAAQRAQGEGSAARRLLALGADVVHLARRLDERWDTRDEATRRTWASAPLDASGMWPEYARLRGLDAHDGRLTPAAREAFEAGRELPWPAELTSAPETAAAARVEPAPATARGTVHVHASGPLAEALGGDLELELDLPAEPRAVLEALAREREAARRLLFAAARPLPSIYRAGERVADGDAIRAGDRLDLVLVISGGAR